MTAPPSGDGNGRPCRYDSSNPETAQEAIVGSPGYRARQPTRFGQVLHAQPRRHFAHAFSAGGEEPAEQAARAEFLEPSEPAISATVDSVQNPGKLGRNGRFALAEEPACVIDKHQVAAE
jgi:hypothetical protein